MFAEKPLLSWLFETHVASQLSGVLPFGWIVFRFLASHLFTLHTDMRNVFP